jgi:site-specific DNA-methyltransferase (adenine-specific)/site-specific DNA-methyltransferase (cytosine-N4-specific)
MNNFIHGDSRYLPLCDGAVDLVMTSPPYADARSHTYGGVHPDKYVEWFLPIGAEIMRVLKPTGSFVLNIKEKVVNGERHTYVMELIIALRSQGWLFTEEYIWHKSNCSPGYWPNRFRDAWERCLHFTRARKFYMDQHAVKVPAGDWQLTRLAKESRNDGTRHESNSKSGFGRKVSNWMGKTTALPTNVLRIAPVSRNVGHSAPFPIELPTFFIKLFSKLGDVVLDPFGGSGTTALAVEKLGRRCITIERQWEYIALAVKRQPVREPTLFAQVAAKGVA